MAKNEQKKEKKHFNNVTSNGCVAGNRQIPERIDTSEYIKE